MGLVTSHSTLVNVNVALGSLPYFREDSNEV